MFEAGKQDALLGHSKGFRRYQRICAKLQIEASEEEYAKGQKSGRAALCALLGVSVIMSSPPQIKRRLMNELLPLNLCLFAASFIFLKGSLVSARAERPGSPLKLPLLLPLPFLAEAF